MYLSEQTKCLPLNQRTNNGDGAPFLCQLGHSKSQWQQVHDGTLILRQSDDNFEIGAALLVDFPLR